MPRMMRASRDAVINHIIRNNVLLENVPQLTTKEVFGRHGESERIALAWVKNACRMIEAGRVGSVREMNGERVKSKLVTARLVQHFKSQGQGGK